MQCGYIGPGSLLSSTVKTTHKNIDYFISHGVPVLTFISWVAVSGHCSPGSFINNGGGKWIVTLL